MDSFTYLIVYASQFQLAIQIGESHWRNKAITLKVFYNKNNVKSEVINNSRTFFLSSKPHQGISWCSMVD